MTRTRILHADASGSSRAITSSATQAHPSLVAKPRRRPTRPGASALLHSASSQLAVRFNLRMTSLPTPGAGTGAFAQRRSRLGMTQERLAQIAGVHGRTVHNVEAGKTRNPKTSKQIGDALSALELDPKGERRAAASMTELRGSLELAPGLRLTYLVEGDDDVRLGELRQAERRLRALAADDFPCTVAGWIWACDEHMTHGNADSEDEARAVAAVHEHFFTEDNPDGCDLSFRKIGKR